MNRWSVLNAVADLTSLLGVLSMVLLPYILYQWKGFEMAVVVGLTIIIAAEASGMIA